MKDTTYFVLYSKTSKNSMAGLQPEVMWTFEKQIIEVAEYEMACTGETFEDLAGIEWVEDSKGNLRPARELERDEYLQLSEEKLSDDGRMCIIFKTDEAGAAGFIEAAERYGVGDEAREVVEDFNR